MGLYLRAAFVVVVLTVVAATQSEASPVPDVEWDDVKDWTQSTANSAWSTLTQRAGEGWNYLKWGTKRVVNAAQQGLTRIDGNINDPYANGSNDK